MSFLAFLFILISLVTFVAAQLILKRAMEFSATHGMRNSYFISRVAIGVGLMTVSFFLTLGLLQRFAAEFDRPKLAPPDLDKARATNLAVLEKLWPLLIGSL